MARKELTPQQEKFCNYYLECSSASEAYRRAYLRAEKWAEQAVWTKASALLAKECIQQRIRDLQKAMQERMEINRENIAMPFLRALMADYTDPKERSKHIDTVTVGPNGTITTTISKTRAAEVIRKMFGLDSAEKHEVTGKDGRDLIPARRLSPAELKEYFKKLDEDF